MEKEDRPPKYDLEERTFEFARSVRLFMKRIPKLKLRETDQRGDRANANLRRNHPQSILMIKNRGIQPMVRIIYYYLGFRI